MEYSKQHDATVTAWKQNERVQLPISKIMYCVCDAYGSTLYLAKNSKSLHHPDVLKELEKKVEAYGFCRINRTIIVNMKFIDRLMPDTMEVKLKTGKILKASRRMFRILSNKLQE